MVQVYRSTHNYDFNFPTVSLAFFNKYPNPFSSHVISADTIRQYVDPQTKRLYSERLIRKRGRLPKFALPFLGGITESWILETSVVDPEAATLQSWTRNLDHTRLLKVEELTKYTAMGEVTEVSNTMSFISNFGHWGLKYRIESWSFKQCKERLQSSRRGMAFVMEQLRLQGAKAYTNNLIKQCT